jgi:multidrug efflux system membrane fusion protein
MFGNKPPELLAAALAAALLQGCTQSAATPHSRAEASIPVLVAAVEQRTVPINLRAVGSVEAVASVAIVARVDGPIERVLVRDGQDVVANQPLVQLDAAPLKLQVRMSEANLQRDVAKLEDARAKEERGRPLLEQHYISPDDYAQLRTNLDGATATVAADRATLDQAKLQLTYTTIRAPLAGKIGHIALQTGNMVRASATEPLTILNALDEVDVSFTVPARELQAVRRAAETHQATVTVMETDSPAPGEAMLAASAQVKGSKPAAAGATVITGALSFVDNAVDRQSGTLRLRARMENKSHALWPGQFVAVNLAVGEDRNVIVVPSASIQPGPRGTYVFIVKADSSIEQRPVELLRVADEVTLVSGVQVGERVVIDGQSRLTPGLRVSIRGDDQEANGAKAAHTAARADAT